MVSLCSCIVSYRLPITDVRCTHGMQHKALKLHSAPWRI